MRRPLGAGLRLRLLQRGRGRWEGGGPWGKLSGRLAALPETGARGEGGRLSEEENIGQENNNALR